MNINKSQPFHIAADHNGLETATYDLLIDTVGVATQPVAALQANVITFSNVIVGVVGAHTAAVKAVGPGGSAVSTNLAFDVVAVVPGVPTNIRLIIA